MFRPVLSLVALLLIAGCASSAGTVDPYGNYSQGGYSQPSYGGGDDGGYNGGYNGGYSQPTTGSGPGTGMTGGSVSYSAVVAPLLSQACAGCHTPGGMGNGQFFDQSGQLQYQLVAGNIGQIINQVASGRMPQGRQPLSQQEVAELEAWAQEGAPQN